MAEDLIKAGEAEGLLGISKAKMSRLLKNGTLETFPDPLDLRVKLVRRADVMALKARSQRTGELAEDEESAKKVEPVAA